MEGLIQLVEENIRPGNLPEFFWHHLERDVELLGRSIGRSMDESAITIHLVLKDILQKKPPASEEFEAKEIDVLSYSTGHQIIWPVCALQQISNMLSLLSKYLPFGCHC